jgi:adenine C2-methylase RlmN of 23S rRNA A2503 and tRNA A37
MKEITIKQAQEAVDQWIKEYGVRYFSELTNMACLTEEVGELARIMARKYGDQSFKEGEKDNIGEEIADIFWVLMCIANQTNINITEELKKSFDILSIEVVDTVEAEDTTKFAFKTRDGHIIEAILMYHRQNEKYVKDDKPKLNRITLCISSQVGCAMNCLFCVT